MPSFIPLLDFASEFLFPLLDPHHLGNLRLVNKALAKSIDENVRSKSVAAALAKYQKIVEFTDDTVRIHSCLGKTVIDLTLPTGEIQPFHSGPLFMLLDGRSYGGLAQYRRCEMESGQSVDLSNYVFHAQSPRLLKAESVFIMRRGTVLHGNNLIVKVFVQERNHPQGYIYSLCFVPV
jgi:hypothetical protein